MAYALRLDGAETGRFDTEAAAVAAAREALRARPDAEPEIIDTETGRPCAPGASKSWREELANRIGF